VLGEQEVSALLAEDEEEQHDYAAKLHLAPEQLTLANQGVRAALLDEVGAANVFAATPEEVLLPLMVQTLWENEKLEPAGALKVESH